MAWIESHDALGAHPKTRKLERLLDVSRVTVVGHLHFFWWWALDYAPDGDLTRMDDLDIAIGAEWEDDPAVFVDSMIRAGFLDRDETGKTVIHDWMEYGGKLLQRKKANAARMRDGRAAHVQRTDNESAEHVSKSAEPEKSTGENRREEKNEGLPTGAAPQAGAGAKPAPKAQPTVPPKPKPEKPAKARTAAQLAADAVYERKMLIFEAFCTGIGVDLDGIAAKQRKDPSLRTLVPAILAAPECSPEIIEPLARYTAAAFAWRDGNKLPSLAEVLKAYPEWDQAGRPDKPVPKGNNVTTFKPRFNGSGQRLLTSADLRRTAQGETLDEPERDPNAFIDPEFRVAQPAHH